jgi:hypothetical protein
VRCPGSYKGDIRDVGYEDMAQTAIIITPEF